MILAKGYNSVNASTSPGPTGKDAERALYAIINAKMK